MKRTGIIILITGVTITILTGYSFVISKNVVASGSLEIAQHENQGLTWSPMIGLVVMAIGGGMYQAETAKK